VAKFELIRDELAVLKYVLKNWFNKTKELLINVYPKAEITTLSCEIMMFK
jgi:vacuolar-type H+-ATPase subunit E/Vma4